MRVCVHDQQPELRMPLVDKELRRRYDLAINECGDYNEDELIQLSELELMRSSLGDQINEPPLAELLKTSEPPKLPKDSYFRIENCEDIIEFTTRCSDLFLAKPMTLCQYPALVRTLLDSTDATEKTKSELNILRDSETYTTKHFNEPEQFNTIILDRLRPHPVDYLLEKFLNDMQNKKMNVEVRTERVHKAMAILEERYRNSDTNTIHLQLLKVQRYHALMYYRQQARVNALIKANKQPDGGEGRLSDIEQTKFHTMAEASIRAASNVQGDRMLRKRMRVQNKRQNTQTTNQAESSTTATNKRHKPDSGALNQTNRTGQAQEKKGASMSLL
ncbi:hypothetical protein SARC_06697 [Sphaeroforma arctica JP610]|uniref:Uncharacterized protein n=1 Tax=Sphaeroforma arctica JP610 TaxID=667725 RepID=A0A0L0FVU0_9EUKA|nr:hypothetical protein SARC_06697 [Sphaeroforma arctica JP610]KNC80965.1 hypothetical protein SARC_06697 [Sphaeroforma arctica JP610]|eukprot:XP_014154867.1 hypothetical protein SARC_06697 [Sphaeroforma arctica JP610]